MHWTVWFQWVGMSNWYDVLLVDLATKEADRQFRVHWNIYCLPMITMRYSISLSSLSNIISFLVRHFWCLWKKIPSCNRTCTEAVCLLMNQYSSLQYVCSTVHTLVENPVSPVRTLSLHQFCTLLICLLDWCLWKNNFQGRFFKNSFCFFVRPFFPTTSSSD